MEGEVRDQNNSGLSDFFFNYSGCLCCINLVGAFKSWIHRAHTILGGLIDRPTFNNVSYNADHYLISPSLDVSQFSLSFRT